MAKKSRRLDFDAALALSDRPRAVANITFAELCAAYCAVAYDDADFRLRKWAGGLGERSAWSITRDMLQHCAEAMLAAGYKPSTVNRDVAQIGTIFKWAKKKRMTPCGLPQPAADFDWLGRTRAHRPREREGGRQTARGHLCFEGSAVRGLRSPTARDRRSSRRGY